MIGEENDEKRGLRERIIEKKNNQGKG